MLHCIINPGKNTEMLSSSLREPRDMIGNNCQLSTLDGYDGETELSPTLLLAHCFMFQTSCGKFHQT